jgi:hypothetical protein
MPWLFLILSLALGIVAGLIVFSEAALFGQIVQGLLSIACFALIVAAFWLYGWKIGVLDTIVVFAGANVGLSLFKRVVKKSRQT